MIGTRSVYCRNKGGPWEIHSSDKHLMNTRPVPGTGLGTRDTVLNKGEPLPSGEHVPVEETKEKM